MGTKRKLVKQGGSAMTITLPKSWVDKYGLKPGDEIDVEERGRMLSIGTNKEIKERTTILDTRKLNNRTIRWALSSLHKSGYDSIEVLFDDSNVMDIVNELVKNLFMGFAVVEQSTKRVLLKNISQDLESEFDVILRRAFLVTISMGESTLEFIKEKNFKNMKNLISLESTNNQLTNFCERVLNKKGAKDHRKTCFMYVISWNLEKICDNYKYICEFLVGKTNIKLNQETINFYEKSNKLMRNYYEIFYNFDIQKLSEWSEDRKELVKEGQNIMGRLDPINEGVIHHIQNLIYQLADFSASTIAINQID
ncbi:phosphate uptake regulator PhoU [Candidatus Woesearchaeota archaeon]|nr:phosphate uptake regulator PhoU [Candidatus Woesearchaeota archaeon]